jgi:hypothetical protein
MDDLDALLEDLDAAGIGGGGGGAAKGVSGSAAPPLSRTSAQPRAAETDGTARSTQVTASRAANTGGNAASRPSGNLDELDDLLGELDAVMGTGVSPLSQRPKASSAPSMTSSTTTSHHHASAAKPSDKPSTTDANPTGVPAPVDRGGYGGYGGGGGGATLVANPRPSSSSAGPSGGTNRCAPCPNIGGGDSRLGRASFMSPDAACDALRCVSCDFDVVSFDGVAWARGEGGAKGAGVDYMFFRNNYPDAGKMECRAVGAKGWRAYCCQCSWRSVGGGGREKVDAVGGELRWVCGGH